MPSCLVELGFLTDETDNKDFDAHMDEYAKAVADAVIKTCVELGITDKDGKRLINGPFFTDDKKLAADAQAKKPQTVSKPYNTQENEY
jgi:N-acetylmuramoyl-L-alanine amidase